jgi:hypothetical protein
LWPKRRHHEWTLDFMHERTHVGRALRLMTVSDEYSKEGLATVVGRHLNSSGSATAIARFFLEHDAPRCIISDIGADTARSTHAFLDDF